MSWSLLAVLALLVFRPPRTDAWWAWAAWVAVAAGLIIGAVVVAVARYP